VTALAPPTAGALPSRDSVMAKAEHENFTVASAVLGRRRRMHLMAIYGFARLVDDVGDEVAGDRAALLDEIEADLDLIYDGTSPRHSVMSTLADAVWACRLPDSPFRRLIAANRHDQVVTRYETFRQLLDYCRLSAAPVGELVLHVFGLATAERILLSDRICAGLQVTEHLQDVAEDLARGRVYLPREDLARFGCGEDDIAAPRPAASYRALIAFEAQRARSLLSEGAPLARTLPLRPRIAVAGFVAGGRGALDALLGTLDPPGGRGAGAGAGRSRRAFALGFAKAAMGR
jgi:squalene synthase HpnC